MSSASGVKGSRTGQDVVQLRLVSARAQPGAGFPEPGGRLTSPGGAPSTKEEMVSRCSIGCVASKATTITLAGLEQAEGAQGWREAHETGWRGGAGGCGGSSGAAVIVSQILGNLCASLFVQGTAVSLRPNLSLLFSRSWVSSQKRC